MRMMIALLMLLPLAAFAETRPLLNVGVNGGGDRLAEIEFTDNTSQTLRAGNGLAMNVGLVHFFDESPLALQASFGYLVDETSARNSRARFSRYPLEAMLVWTHGSHRIGGGLVHHFSPTLDLDNLGGKVDFDDSTGFVVEYGYRLFSFRYLKLDYTLGGLDSDGSGFGVYFELGY